MLDYIIVILVVLFGLVYIAKLFLQKYEIDAYWYYTFQYAIEWVLNVLPDIIFGCFILKLIIWILI